VLFFEKSGRTREVWFYELPLPEGRKGYSKTRALRFEEFADCQTWWGGPERKGREETGQAWRVAIGDIETTGWNLDRKNPNRPDDLAHRPPGELVTELVKTEHEILDLLQRINAEIGTEG